MTTQRTKPSPRMLALLLALALVLVGPLCNRPKVPLYEPISIGELIRSAYPTAGISSAVALNENGDAVGYAMIDNHFHAFVFTEAHGVRLLPALSAAWPSHVAVDVTDRDGQDLLLIAGNALSGGATDQNRDPGNALLWIYDASADVVVETVDIGVLPSFDLSRVSAINNSGLAVGFSRQDGFLGATQPMVYDYASRTLHAADLPFTPVDINEQNWTAGAIPGPAGAARALLAPDGSVASPVETLGHPADASVGTVTAINDEKSIVATVGLSRTDGAGRFLTGAGRFTDLRGWEVVWTRSAFDWAHGLNDVGNVVGDIGIANAIRGALYISGRNETFLLEDLVDPPGFFLESARDVNGAGWIVGGYAAATLMKRIGDMPPPTPPADLTAVPHFPTWQQPWNAITLEWVDTSTLTRGFFVERRAAGATAWTEIKADWLNTQLWDMDVALGATYDYRVRAKGIAGFSGYSEIATATAPSEPVDTEAPEVSITSPDGTQALSGRVRVLVEAFDNVGVTYLEVEVLSSLSRTTLCWAADVTSLDCSWNTRKLEPGSYQLRALAVDAMNNGAYDVVTVQLGGG